MSVERVVALGRLPHLPPGARPGGATPSRSTARSPPWDSPRRATGWRPGFRAANRHGCCSRAVSRRDAPLLLADEPVSGLDPSHQIATMERFRALADEGRGILASLHDLALAYRWCDRIVLLDAGRRIADGPPGTVLAPGNLRAVFGIEARLVDTGEGQGLHVLGLAS